MNNKNLLIGAGVVIAGYLLLKNYKTKPTQKKSLKNRVYSKECEIRYSQLMQPSVVMPPEYWEKKKEDWMKINCK
jgi:hypothetical protein